MDNVTKKYSHGFTLLELSIVLVIIGLIVGGVLVGQDLIKAASLRATVSQYEKYNAVLNTFRLKFGGVPGDMVGAGAFGLDEFTTPDSGLGDGDGFVYPGDGFPTDAATNETLMFWRHLSQANLIDGSFGAPGTPNAIDLANGKVTGTVNTTGLVAGSFPQAKIGNGNFFLVYSEYGQNFFQIIGVESIMDSEIGSRPNMTPREAFDIDSKIDNGAPHSGRIIALDSTYLNTPFISAGTDATHCVTALDDSGTYNIGQAGANSRTCSIRLRFN